MDGWMDGWRATGKVLNDSEEVYLKVTILVGA